MRNLELWNEIAHLGEIIVIGRTHYGYDIPLVRVGHGKRRVLIVSSVHGREHITTSLTNALVGILDKERYSLDYVPMLNIDGVMLSRHGLDFIENYHQRRRLLMLNGCNRDFSLWKANFRGVDINVNFDADWGEGASNVLTAGSENYIGNHPESENETRAAANLLRQGDYSLVVAYHSKGEVIYWGYESNFKHYESAKRIADKMGYALQRSEHSAGGLKDYYAGNFYGLGLTVEIGRDDLSHPYPERELPNLIEQHKGTLELICETAEEIYEKVHGGGTARG